MQIVVAPDGSCRCLYGEELDLQSLVTRTYPLEGVNDGYRDLRDGRNIRGVLVYD